MGCQAMFAADHLRRVELAEHVIECEVARKGVSDLSTRWNVVDDFVVQQQAVDGIAETDGTRLGARTAFVLSFFHVVCHDP